MPLPGHEINVQDFAQGGANPADTGVAFFVGETPRGPNAPTPLNSYGDLLAQAGDKPANGVLYDDVESAFATGLSLGYVVRVTSDGAVAATVDLPDASEDPAITATASSVGAWGNGLKVEVVTVTGGKVRLNVTLDGKLVEQSPATDSRADLLDWGTDTARYVVLTAGSADELPSAAAPVALAGGDDDSDNIDVDAYETALAKITAEFPVGQLRAPGVTDEDVQLALLTKGGDVKRRRFAVLDHDPAWGAAEILARAEVLTDGGLGENGTIVSPRVRAPAQGGGQRWVYPGGVWCGRANHTDRVAGCGQAPAGEDYGESSYMLDVEATYTDDEREALNEAGVIVIARVAGAPRIYGARTLADTSVHPAYKWVVGSRAVMRVTARADAILERYVLRRASGDRAILVDLSNDLNAMGEEERAALTINGATPEEAYTFDTRYPSVNSQASLADGWLRANGEIRTNAVAERVQLNLAVRSAADTITGA